MTKGADSSVAERAINGKSEQLPQSFSEQVDAYLEMGFRVMFMGIRLLSKKEFESFLKEVKEIENDPKSTSEDIYNKKCDIEQHLTIFGATAIEDKL